MGVLDFLFPKKCVNCKKAGEYICTDCFTYLSFNDSGICLVCNKNSINGLTHPGCCGRYTIDGSFSSLNYNPIAKKLIYRFKYKPYLLDLESLLSELFFEGLIQNETLAKTIEQSSNPLRQSASEASGAIILVPIPLHSSKLRRRGYNQSEILAKGLSERLEIPIADVLFRVKNTENQFKLDRKERMENMRDAFALRPNILISEYPSIFLVDDILTTGSTLLAAANILKRAGADKVFGLTLSREQ